MSEEESKGQDSKPQSKENEIRIAAKGEIRNYVNYAKKTLEKHAELKISATGNAISKALILIEVVKREIDSPLHQQNSIKSIEIVDESKEKKKIEGMDEEVVHKRRVTAMDTILSKAAIDEGHLGYQPPLSQEAKEQHKKDHEEKKERQKAQKAQKQQA
jgi:DNA-binding protein